MIETATDVFSVLLIAVSGMLLTVFWNSEVLLKVRAHFAQQPLESFSAREQNLAFLGAPELRQRVERRGTMSRHEYRQAMRLSLKRVRAELKRRGVQ